MLIFFAILLSFIYFIVFVGEEWLRDGSEILAMIFFLTLERWRSLFLVWFISRDKRWRRDGVGDRGGERGSDNKRDRGPEGLQVLLLNVDRFSIGIFWVRQWGWSFSSTNTPENKLVCLLCGYTDLPNCNDRLLSPIKPCFVFFHKYIDEDRLYYYHHYTPHRYWHDQKKKL